METTIEKTENNELKIVTPLPAKVEVFTKQVIESQISNWEKSKQLAEENLALWNQRKTDAINLGIDFN